MSFTRDKKAFLFIVKMAVGIFRKLQENIIPALKWLRGQLPNIAKLALAAAPILTTVNPALGGIAGGIAAGAAGIDKFIGKFENGNAAYDGLANPTPPNDLKVDFNNDVSPYIKFKKNI